MMRPRLSGFDAGQFEQFQRYLFRRCDCRMHHDMAGKRTLVLVLTWLVVVSSGWAATKERSVDPESLIVKARSKEILWTEGTPKLALRAEIQVANGQGGWANAEYLFAWASPSQWREEIKFADYDRLRIGSEKGYWQTSTLNYKPEFVFQLDEMLHVNTLLELSQGETLGRVKQREENGITEDCTDVKNKFGTGRTLCFDDSTGALVAVEYSATGIWRIEYSDFRPVAGKILPFEVRATSDGRTVASMKVAAVGDFGDEAAVFTAPANAEFWARCNDMPTAMQPEPHQARPVYPMAAKAMREQGTVVFYAIVEPDGSVAHLTPIQTAAPDLVAAAAEAVRTWRYKPAICDGKPVRRETRIAVEFTLAG